MSRHTHQIQMVDLKTGVPKRYTVAYGFDDPIQEYFIQVMSEFPDENSKDVVFIDEGSKTSGKSNSQIAIFYLLFEVPKKYIDAISMDIPF